LLHNNKRIEYSMHLPTSEKKLENRLFMTLSVIVVTLNRPQELRRCLQCLHDQVPRPEQVIVVDASPDDLSRRISEEFASLGLDVLYLRNENGYGHMTQSRNIGLLRATGEIIAFLDDDSFAHAGWRENLLATYDDSKVGAVGGRALRDQPGEESEGVDEIGKLKPDGSLTGFFAANPGRILEVDHIIGCNMSFRREALAKLGGFREDYPGSSVREETDLCLRVREIGYRILFNPKAVVDHLGAPQAQGQRFDVRYSYYFQRNHVVMLWRNFGPKSPIFSRYLLLGARDNGWDSLKRIGSGVVRMAAFLGGTAAGMASGYRIVSRAGRSPVRNDEEGRKLRKALSQPARQAPSHEDKA